MKRGGQAGQGSRALDRAVHLEDRAFAGSDTLATARTLAKWLKGEKFDLIMLGKYSLDAETGQVGPEIAELLGVAQITGVRKVRIEGRTIAAERESDEGYDEVECAMPAVLTCAERVAQPIRVKPEAAEQASSLPIETVRAAALDSNPAHISCGSTTNRVGRRRFGRGSTLRRSARIFQRKFHPD